MQNILEIGDTKAKPGTIEKGSLGGVEIGDGLVAKVPVINVNGIEEDKTLVDVRYQVNTSDLRNDKLPEDEKYIEVKFIKNGKETL